MSNINSDQRSSFFPQSRTAQEARINKVDRSKFLKRNDISRIQELKDISGKDSKVQISDAVRDFARIKKVVDASPEIDNSEKIAQLKEQIQNNKYKFDYEALADKLLESQI